MLGSEWLASRAAEMRAGTLVGTAARVLWALALFATVLPSVGCSQTGSSSGVPRVDVEGAVELRTLWNCLAGSNCLIGGVRGPQASGDVVVFLIGVPQAPDVVHALDAATGRLLWERTGEGFAVSGSNAVVITGGMLSGVGSRSGTVRWTRPLDAQSEQRWAGLAVGDDKVLLAMDGRVAALSAETGEELWTSDEVTGDADQGALVALLPTDETIAVVSYRAAGPVVGLRSTDGSAVWRYDPPEPVLSLPWLEGEVLLLRTEGRVVALELATGNPRWEMTIPLAPQGGSAVAALAGRAYVVTGKALAEIDLGSGAVLTERELPEPLAIVGPSVLVVVDNLLGVACLRLDKKKVQAVFYLYDPNGRRIAYASPIYEKAVVSRLVSAGQRLFFISQDAVITFELATDAE